MTDINLRSRKWAGPETRLSTLREPFPASISYAKPREVLSKALMGRVFLNLCNMGEERFLSFRANF